MTTTRGHKEGDMIPWNQERVMDNWYRRNVS